MVNIRLQYGMVIGNIYEQKSHKNSVEMCMKTSYVKVLTFLVQTTWKYFDKVRMQW